MGSRKINDYSREREKNTELRTFFIPILKKSAVYYKGTFTLFAQEHKNALVNKYININNTYILIYIISLASLYSLIPESATLESSTTADPLQAEGVFGRVFISDSEDINYNH